MRTPTPIAAVPVVMVVMVALTGRTDAADAAGDGGGCRCVGGGGDDNGGGAAQRMVLMVSIGQDGDVAHHLQAVHAHATPAGQTHKQMFVVRWMAALCGIINSIYSRASR